MVFDIWIVLKSIFLLFIITDPLGNVPIFLHVMKGIKKEKRMGTINNAFITAVVVMLFFAFFSNRIFEFFNISFESFLISGGILLFFVAFGMTRGKKDPLSGSLKNFGVVPLGIPLIAGPGAITMVILLSQSYGILTAIISIISAAALMWITFKHCDKLVKLFGDKSSDTVTRIMGIILGAISVQFILTGLQSIF